MLLLYIIYFTHLKEIYNLNFNFYYSRIILILKFVYYSNTGERL